MAPFRIQIEQVRERVPLSVVLLGAVLVLWIAGVLVPQIACLDARSNDSDRVMRLVEERRRLIADREAILARHKSLAPERVVIGNEEVDATTVMRSLTRKGIDRGLYIVRMGPASVPPSGTVHRVGAELDLRGDLKSLVRFLYDVEHGPDPLMVSYLAVRSPRPGQSDVEARVSAVRTLP